MTLTETRSRTTLRLGALVPAVLGLAVAIYLTVEHYSGSTTLSCPDTGAINCAKVTTSSYSHFVGVPVALGGAIYFAVMAALLSPPAWRRRALDPVRLGLGVLGIIAVLYLVSAELFAVDALCLWCTVVHICTVWMFVAVIWYSIGREPVQPS